MASTTQLQLLLLSAFSLSQLVAQPNQQKGPAPPAPVRDVTVKAIPGVVEAGAKWTLVWQGTETADGIVGVKNGLLMAQEQTNRINKLDKNDKFSVYLETAHGPGAVAIGPKGRILVVERTCTDPGGHLGTKPEECKEPTGISALTPMRKVLADSIGGGKSLGRVNDLVADKKGGAYFSSGGAFYLSPGGQVTSIGENLRANGIMLSPDEKTLYVTNGPAIAAFDVQPDGLVKNQREFGKLDGGVNGDGMAIDAAGRLYVTTNPGVQVFSPEGKFLGLIPTPRNAITTAFSGPGKKTLYVGTLGSVGPNGQQFTTPAGVRNTAMTVYKIPMLAQGFKGRAK